MSLWLSSSLVASAAAPELTYLFPPGGQRGTTVAVETLGKTDAHSTQAWVDSPGVTLEATDQPGNFRAVISADAVPGVRWVRLWNSEGVSAPRPFVVGTLPEQIDREPNDELRTAQAVSASGTTVNGRLATAGDVDVYSVTLDAGQTLIASVEAERPLGSPMDGVLQVLDASGVVVGQNHDDRGLDPRLVFAAPSKGVYFVRLFAFPAAPTAAIRLAGGEQFVYRLSITAGPSVDYAYPLAVEAARPSAVELHGWNIPQAIRRLTITTPADQETWTVFHPQMNGVASLAVVAHAAVVEQEPAASAPQQVELPVTVSGRIDRPGDVDTFRFQAPENETVLLRIESQSLGFPLDASLRLVDPDGAECLTVDDVEGRQDPELIYSIPFAGEYQMTIRDLYGHGGPRYAYRLHATLVRPDFALKVGAHAFNMATGTPLEIPVTVERRNDLSDEITIEVQGLPASVVAEPGYSRAEDGSAQSGNLTLTARQPGWSGPIRIIGRSAGKFPQRHAAEADVSELKAKTTDLWLTVLPGN